MKKKLSLSFILTMLLLVVVSPRIRISVETMDFDGESGVDWWTMFHHDSNHTGYSASTAPNTNNTIWNYTTGGPVLSSPAVADAKVYVGSADGKVYCLNALTGTYIWHYTTGFWVLSSPAVADAKVYVGSMDNKTYCLNASTGAHIWSYTTGNPVYSSPAVADGVVFVGSWDSKVYALNASTGAHIWSYTTGDFVYSSPAVADGKVYVGSDDGKVYCLDASTGAYIWSYTTGGAVYSSPAVADGRIYVGSRDDKVYCLNALTGEFIWSYTTGDPVESSPAVADGVVFVGSGDGKVYCLDASTGAHIWSYTTGDDVYSSPAVADGVVFVGSWDSKVYALNASTGAHIWSYTTGDFVYSSPAVADGKVYVGSGDGKVYAFGPVYTLTITATSGGTTDPPPGTHTYAVGTVVSVSAIPYIKCAFDHWELDGSWDYSNPISIAMYSDHTLHAVFSCLPINVGIIGPTGLIQGQGMWEGAQLAATEMGWTMGGHPIVLKMRDEFQGESYGTFETGYQAMEQLVADGCDFVIGGFRTESVVGAREAAMDFQKIFIITGAATNELIDCGTGTCGACVRCDYERYKYLFRAMPINSSMLVASITGVYYKGIRGFLQTVLETLVGPYGFDSVSPMYGPTKQVKVAVITENLLWCQGFWQILTIPAYYMPYCGPLYNLSYSAQVSPTQEIFTTEMTGIKNNECRLVIMILSGPAGRSFTTAMYDQQVPAVAVGINVIEQMSESWFATSGKVEYETFLVTSGTRTPITVRSLPFWDAYVAMHGHAPIYTAYGTYNSLYLLKEAVEAVRCDTDAIIGYLETAGPRLTPTGLLDFTSMHDLLCYSVGEEWPDGHVRALMGQWQAGKIEIVNPKYSVSPAILPYWKRWMISPHIYNFSLDLNYDGVVNMRDISLAARAFGSYPCHPMYDRGAAIIVDDYPDGYDDEPVTMRDISKIARAFGTDYTDHWPLPYDWYT